MIPYAVRQVLDFLYNLLEYISNFFLKLQKQAFAEVHEDANVDTMMYTIMADDPDVGKNGEITYTLSGKRSQDFSIGKKNGQIVTKAKLDYEIHPYYNLTVTAKDYGDRYCETRLIIEVKNVNDNPPKFERDVYDFQVREGLNNAVVGRVRAFDPDLGSYFSFLIQAILFQDKLFKTINSFADANQLITYQISDSSNKFGIDSEKGIITLLESLDREKIDKYTFQVVANDDVRKNPN